MSYYTHKPGLIFKAIQWDGESAGLAAISSLAKEDITYDSLTRIIRFDSPRGLMRAEIDDWVIKGVLGYCYVVEAAAFSLLYIPFDFKYKDPTYTAETDLLTADGSIKAGDTFTIANKAEMEFTYKLKGPGIEAELEQLDSDAFEEMLDAAIDEKIDIQRIATQLSKALIIRERGFRDLQDDCAELNQVLADRDALIYELQAAAKINEIRIHQLREKLKD